MIPVEDALARILALVVPLPEETVTLRRAGGRVLAAAVTAQLTQPPFDASAMDGYWLARADHRPGAQLRVEGEAAAGRGYDGPLAPGQAVRIFTGAPCPAPGGVVVLQEDVTRTEDQITLPVTLSEADNIRPRGQDFIEGAEFFPKHRLSARDLGVIAAMNVPEVRVHRRPVVAVIATGDELVLPGETPAPDQIISSNSFLVATLAEEAGAEVRVLPIARDTKESLRFVFELAQDADLIVTSGGVSVGDHDLVGQVAGEMGFTPSFWKIAMRPGKPLMAGKMGGAVLVGLPGNPVSAAVCSTIYLKPMIARLQGLEALPHTEAAILGADVGPTGPRTHYMRAWLDRTTTPPTITPFDSQDSARLMLLARADALLIRPVGDIARSKGEMARYLPL